MDVALKRSGFNFFTKISGVQAKEMMDADSSVIVLDVRTEEEYNQGHIEGSILIPNTEINKGQVKNFQIKMQAY